MVKAIDGEEWLVYETPAGFDPRTTPSLIFEGPFMVRRVRSFPENWRDLPDDELLRLSWSV